MRTLDDGDRRAWRGNFQRWQQYAKGFKAAEKK